MTHLDHTAFVNSRRDERSLGYHTLRTFAGFIEAHEPTDPLSKDNIVAYHRHFCNEQGAKQTHTTRQRPHRVLSQT